MKPGKLIKYAIGMGSLCLSAWQIPQLMDAMQGKGAPGAPGSPGSPGGPPGVAGLIHALGGAGMLGQAGAQATGADAGLSLVGAPVPKPAAPQAKEPTKPGDIMLFSADGKNLTPEQREKLLKDAARQAPLKPGAKVSVVKPGVKAPAAAPEAKKDDSMAKIDEQAIEDITRQLKEELGKQKP